MIIYRVQWKRHDQKQVELWLMDGCVSWICIMEKHTKSEWTVCLCTGSTPVYLSNQVSCSVLREQLNSVKEQLNASKV